MGRPIGGEGASVQHHEHGGPQGGGGGAQLHSAGSYQPTRESVLICFFSQVAELVASTPLQSPAGRYLLHLDRQYNEVLGKVVDRIGPV